MSLGNVQNTGTKHKQTAHNNTVTYWVLAFVCFSFFVYIFTFGHVCYRLNWPHSQLFSLRYALYILSYLSSIYSINTQQRMQTTME